MEHLLLALTLLFIINILIFIYMIHFHRQVDAMPVISILLAIFGADIGLIIVLLTIIFLVFNGFDIKQSQTIKTLVILAIFLSSISIFSCGFNIFRAKKYIAKGK